MNDLSDDDEKTLDKVWDDFHKDKNGKRTSVSTSAQLKGFDDKLAQKAADTWYRKDGSPKTRAMMEHQIQDTMERYNLDLNEAASLMDRSHELNNVYDEHYTPFYFSKTIEKMRSPDYPYELPKKKEESKVTTHEYSEQPIEDRKVKSLLGTSVLNDPFRDDIKDTQHSMDHPDKLLRKNLKIREPKNKTRNNFGKIPSGLTTDKPEKDLDDQNPNSDINQDHEEVINKKSLQHDDDDPVKLFLVGSIQVDPDRLQYKDYDDEDGLNDERRGDKNTLNDGKPKEIFDPLKCPPIALWKDEDGQINVVDGHKRLGAAKRDGSSIIRGYFVHADDADEAKDIGERINTNMGTKSIQTPGEEEG